MAERSPAPLPWQWNFLPFTDRSFSLWPSALARGRRTPDRYFSKTMMHKNPLGCFLIMAILMACSVSHTETIGLTGRLRSACLPNIKRAGGSVMCMWGPGEPHFQKHCSDLDFRLGKCPPPFSHTPPPAEDSQRIDCNGKQPHLRLGMSSEPAHEVLRKPRSQQEHLKTWDRAPEGSEQGYLG